jgi:hypothetical protein
METGSVFFILSIFFLGASCGGLFITMHRQARVEQIKTAFREELLAECAQSAPLWTAETKPRATEAGAAKPNFPVSEIEPDILDEVANPNWDWTPKAGGNSSQAGTHA